MNCIQCGVEIFGRKNKRFCSTRCNRKHYDPTRPPRRSRTHPYLRRPLTQEEKTARAYAAAASRRKSTMKDVPDSIILTIHNIIGKKLKMPAQLISVQGVFKLMLKRCKREKSDSGVLNEGVYFYIYEKLEEAGGILTDFRTTSGTSRRHKDAPMRAVFRFPPLEERER